MPKAATTSPASPDARHGMLRRLLVIAALLPLTITTCTVQLVLIQINYRSSRLPNTVLCVSNRSHNMDETEHRGRRQWRYWYVANPLDIRTFQSASSIFWNKTFFQFAPCMWKTISCDVVALPTNLFCQLHPSHALSVGLGNPSHPHSRNSQPLHHIALVIVSGVCILRGFCGSTPSSIFVCTFGATLTGIITASFYLALSVTMSVLSVGIKSVYVHTFRR